MIIGIDLGTTNSLVAVWSGETARLIPNALGKTLTPSVVGLDDHGQLIVGDVARERLQTHPQLTTALFKRNMGSAHETLLGHRTYRAEELSAMVLRSLKEDVERALGEPVTEAVISVPAYFSDAQRKATRVAGELAGLKVEKLINEPTAAALAYGLHHKEEATFLVFDLGGGTFDVSVLELFEGVMEVRASAGDNFLGERTSMIGSSSTSWNRLRAMGSPIWRPAHFATGCGARPSGYATRLVGNPPSDSPSGRVSASGRSILPKTNCSSSTNPC